MMNPGFTGKYSDLMLNHSKRICGKRNTILFIILSVALILLFLLDLALGSVNLAFGDTMNAFFRPSGNESDTIILKFRLPKALTALMVGIALSVSGLQMQTVFRNPMAGPYVLGISSGASLGVAFIILGFSSFFPSGNAGNWILVGAAWAGAGAVLLIIMAVSVRVKDIMTVLIIGIMLAAGISAVVTVLQYFSNETMLRAYVIWTMGSLGNLASGQLRVLVVSVIAGLIISIFSVKTMNALLLGENYAISLGVNVKSARTMIFVCTSILAGSVTAFCGPIGFIGIAVPHIARIMFRTSDHRVLLPAVILTGGALMLFSDIVSQVPGSERVLPVNAITSFTGIPVVIWVILKNRKYSGVF
jgi:iron complex transport system permease protein